MLDQVIRAYADGRLERHAFIDTLAAWEFADRAEPSPGEYNEIVLSAPGSIAELDRAYLSGLIEDETYRDIYAARRLRERS